MLGHTYAASNLTDYFTLDIFYSVNLFFLCVCCTFFSLRGNILNWKFLYVPSLWKILILKL